MSVSRIRKKNKASVSGEWWGRDKVDRAEAGEEWRTRLRWASISRLKKSDINLNMILVAGSIEVSASASMLPMNIQDWLTLGWTGWLSLQPKGLSKVFSTPQFKSINSSVLSLLYGPTLTSVRDYWKNRSLGGPLLANNVSAFYTLSRFVITFLPRSNVF